MSKFIFNVEDYKDMMTRLKCHVTKPEEDVDMQYIAISAIPADAEHCICQAATGRTSFKMIVPCIAEAGPDEDPILVPPLTLPKVSKNETVTVERLTGDNANVIRVSCANIYVDTEAQEFSVERMKAVCKTASNLVFETLKTEPNAIYFDPKLLKAVAESCKGASSVEFRFGQSGTAPVVYLTSLGDSDVVGVIIPMRVE